jgi:hypothetical protein
MATQDILSSTMKTRRRFLLLAAYVLLAMLGVGLIAYWVWSLGEEQRAIRDLPTDERRAFFERTLQNLTTVCVGSDAVHLGDFCRKEAERILLFPECDDHCQDLARRHLPRPVRKGMLGSEVS